MAEGRDPAEWLDVAPRRLGGRDAKVLLGIGALVLALLVVGIVVYQRRTAAQTVPPPVPHSSASIPPSRTPSPSPSVVRPNPRSSIVESRVGSSVLTASNAYEVIGYGPSGLSRWRPRDGRMIQTDLPDISDGLTQGGGLRSSRWSPGTGS